MTKRKVMSHEEGYPGFCPGYGDAEQAGVMEAEVVKDEAHTGWEFAPDRGKFCVIRSDGPLPSVRCCFCLVVIERPTAGEQFRLKVFHYFLFFAWRGGASKNF